MVIFSSTLVVADVTVMSTGQWLQRERESVYAPGPLKTFPAYRERGLETRLVWKQRRSDAVPEDHILTTNSKQRTCRQTVDASS